MFFVSRILRRKCYRKSARDCLRVTEVKQLQEVIHTAQLYLWEVCISRVMKNTHHQADWVFLFTSPTKHTSVLNLTTYENLCYRQQMYLFLLNSPLCCPWSPKNSPKHNKLLQPSKLIFVNCSLANRCCSEIQHTLYAVTHHPPHQSEVWRLCWAGQIQETWEMALLKGLRHFIISFSPLLPTKDLRHNVFDKLHSCALRYAPKGIWER